MQPYNFIKTSDIESAQTLQALGYPLIDEVNGLYVFVNLESTKLAFAESIDMDKISLTNIYTAS